MSDIRGKIKRQIDIISLALKEPCRHNRYDLCDMFGCEMATINRDLKLIRDMGIPLYTVRQKGIAIEGELQPDMLSELINQYNAMMRHNQSTDRATKALIKKLGEKALIFMTWIQSSIAESRRIRISYKKTYEKKARERLLEPLLIFERENHWRLMAREEGVIKQFLLSRMTDIAMLNDTYPNEPGFDPSELLACSFSAWIGNERHKIVLRLGDHFSEYKKIPVLTENQITTEQPDGTYILELEVSRLLEPAQWIAGQGKAVTVIEPEELRETVLNIASQVIKHHTS
jgi:predicted DNA-binding transcriptional regulator YafY